MIEMMQYLATGLPNVPMDFSEKQEEGPQGNDEDSTKNY